MPNTSQNISSVVAQFTRSGARRAGDDYQDIVAIGFFLDWLENPDAFVSMTVEDEESGVLDDIRKERSDGVVELVQVKFATAPGDPDSEWKWDTLLNERDSRKSPSKKLPSLLARWAQSFFDVQAGGQKVEAFVLTNRLPTTDLSVAIQNEHFLLDRISNAAIKSEIIRQLGGEAKATEFFSATRFQFNQAGLDTLQAHYEQRFYKRGGELVGWLNLKEEVRRWVRYKNFPLPDGIIRLSHIREAAAWKQPRSLPQDFTIPADFVLPSVDFYQNLFEALKQANPACFAVVAPPATGKSTFVSWLCQDLKTKGIPVIRHHYFLSVSDRSSGRLEHERAAESLLHDLLAEHSGVLGNLANDNPQPSNLPRYLERCGAGYQNQGKRLVVIVDGLDHVWSENQSIDELRQLFDLLLPPAPNITVLVAMQPVDEKRLPQSLLRLAPTAAWLSLPTFGLAEIKEWLGHHLDALPKTCSDQARDYQLDRLSKKFHELSGGHPLHLSYSLKALAEKGIAVTPENVGNLPACPHGQIENYYSSLWRVLPQSGQTALMLLSLCEWAWPTSGIVDALQDAGTSLVEAETARREIRHLLSEKFMGLEPHHPSLAAFVRKQDLFQSSGNRLLKAALTWLQTEAPPHWRWAYEWGVQAAIGEAASLRDGPSRKWAIEALALCKSDRDISRILRRSSWEAAIADDWPRVVALGVWLEYVFRAWDGQDHILSDILETQLILGEDDYLRPRMQARLHELPLSHLAALAAGESESRDSTNVQRIAEELRRRFNESVGRKHAQPSAVSVLQTAASVQPMLGEQKTIHFIKYCDEQVRPDLHADIFGIMAKSCVALKIHESMVALIKLTHPSSADSKTSNNLVFDTVLKQATLYALENGIDLVSLLPAFPNPCPPILILHEFLRGRNIKLLSIQEAPVGLFKLDWRQVYDNRALISDGYEAAFWFFAANCICEVPDVNQRWLSQIDQWHWPKTFLTILEGIAKTFAEHLRNHTKFPMADFYNPLLGLSKPRWNSDDLGTSHYADAAQPVVTNLAIDLAVFASALGHPTPIGVLDLEAANQSGWWPSLLWISALLKRRRAWLDQDALHFVQQHEETILAKLGESFDARADICVAVALLSARHGRKDHATNWLRRSAENLLAHGDHKDMSLNEALDAVQTVIPVLPRDSSGNAPQALTWLMRLTPPIVHVREFTDGDEVSHLPVELGKALADAEPELNELRRYHRWLSDEERYGEAEDLLGIIIGKVDLNNPINYALAESAISPEGRKALADRAKSGDEMARKIAQSITADFGELPKKDEDEFRSSTSANIGSLFAQPPKVADFPPEKLGDFLKALEASGKIPRAESITAWVEFWRGHSAPASILAGLRDLRKSNSFFSNFSELFDLQRELEGASPAYAILIEGFREDRGWAHYWSEEEKSRKWRNLLLQFYPDRKKQFLLDTLRTQGTQNENKLAIGPYNWVRLIEFFIQCGDINTAHDMVNQMVSSASELVSPLSLPVPPWATIPLNE